MSWIGNEHNDPWHLHGRYSASAFLAGMGAGVVLGFVLSLAAMWWLR